MNEELFKNWLEEYGKAWENKNSNAFVKIFTEDALYYWTPFGEPKMGKAGIKEAFELATSTQTDITFRYEMLSFKGTKGIAHWSCKLKRITTGKDLTIDGILIAEFDDNNLCKTFREWWHTNEI